MGAKKKPQETLSLADLGVDADAAARPARAPRCSRSTTRRRAARRRKIEDDGNAAAADRRVPRGEEADVSTLVFLEHHEGELQKGSLGVLVEGGAARRRRRRRVVIGSGVRGARRRGRRVRRRRRSSSPTTQRSRRRCRSRASTCSRSSSATGGFDTVLFARRCSRPTSPPGSRRGSTPGSTGTSSTSTSRDGQLVGKRPALGDSVYVDVGWTSEPRLALFRSGTFDPAETGGAAEVEDVAVELEDFSTRRDDGRAGARRERRARRSRTPT